MVREFIQLNMTVNTVNWKGNQIKIEEVPVLKDKVTGKIWHVPEEIAKAELRQLVRPFDILPRQLPLLLLFHAQPGPFPGGSLYNKYKLNKMLFYQWKELEKIGLGDAFNHNEFEKAKKGPIPKELYSDLDDLKKKGLIELEGGPKEHKTLTATLTPKGKEAAEKLWESVSPHYREITLKVKTWIFPLNPNTIMERVHRDYPEFKEIYQEPDAE